MDNYDFVSIRPRRYAILHVRYARSHYAQTYVGPFLYALRRDVVWKPYQVLGGGQPRIVQFLHAWPT